MKREKEAESIFEELMAINMSDQMKGINLYIQDAQKASRRKKTQRDSHTETRYNQTSKSQRENLKSKRREVTCIEKIFITI